MQSCVHINTAKAVNGVKVYDVRLTGVREEWKGSPVFRQAANKVNSSLVWIRETNQRKNDAQDTSRQWVHQQKDMKRKRQD